MRGLSSVSKRQFIDLNRTSFCCHVEQLEVFLLLYNFFLLFCLFLYFFFFKQSISMKNRFLIRNKRNQE